MLVLVAELFDISHFVNLRAPAMSPKSPNAVGWPLITGVRRCTMTNSSELKTNYTTWREAEVAAPVE